MRRLISIIICEFYFFINTRISGFPRDVNASHKIRMIVINSW